MAGARGGGDAPPDVCGGVAVVVGFPDCHVLLPACCVVATGIGEWGAGDLAVDGDLVVRAGAGPADGCDVAGGELGELDGLGELAGPQVRLGLLDAPNGVSPTTVAVVPGPSRGTVRLCFVRSRSAADTVNVGHIPFVLVTGSASA
jgi:hypothetical protein